MLVRTFLYIGTHTGRSIFNLLTVAVGKLFVKTQKLKNRKFASERIFSHCAALDDVEKCTLLYCGRSLGPNSFSLLSWNRVLFSTNSTYSTGDLSVFQTNT